MRKRALRKVSTFTDHWAAQGLLFVLPAVFFVAVFIVVPVCLNFVLAFTNYRGFGVPYRFIGLKNFQSIFTDTSFWLVLGNTFKLLLIYVVALNVVAVFLAVKIVDVGRGFGNFIKSLLYFPCLLAPVVVGFVESSEKAELMGWRTSDGSLLWVREVPTSTRLTASAGGVFYTALDRPERKEISPSDDLLIEGFEAATGTRLWSTGIPSHNRPFGGEWSITQLSFGAPGGPGWRIGPDGAIYGITLKGAYKLH